MLRSHLCDYSDAYIVVKGRITVEGDNHEKTRNKKLIIKNNASFRTCILKINNTFTQTIVTINLWHLEVCGIIIEIKEIIVPLKIMMMVIRLITTKQ